MNNIVSLELNGTAKRFTTFLVDTGSDLTFLKRSNILDKHLIDSNEILHFKGINGNLSPTYGKVHLNVRNLNNISLKLHLVNDQVNVVADGVIGMDFMNNNIKLDFRNSKLNYFTNNQVISLPLGFHQVENKNILKSRVGAINSIKYSTKKDFTIINIDEGADNNNNSIEYSLPGKINPVDQNNELEINLANKIDTVDQEYRDDKRNHLASNEDIKYKSLGIFENKEIYLPPRSNKIIEIPFEKEFEGDVICFSQELSPGIFMSNSINSSDSSVLKVSVINTHSIGKKIKDIKPNMDSLDNYDLMKYNSNSVEYFINTDVERNTKILENLNLDKDLNAMEMSSIKDICTTYNDIFYLEGDKLSHADSVRHSIPVPQDCKPINQRMYRLPQTHREEVNKQIQELLDNDIIELSKSPWNSPIFLIPKRNENGEKTKWRLVVDFRKLNTITTGDVFPLPRIEEILDQLGHSRYFSTLDLASGYHQVLVEEHDRQKTAFSTNLGHYQFKRMPFGLAGAPATFQRFMNHILTGLQGIDCYVYLDDIIVYGRNLEDHNKKLINVFDRLRYNNLKLQPRKCHFLRKEIVYLGHSCSADGVKPDPSRVSAVRNYPRPKNIKQIQSFLGFANYYRKFIPNFSKKVANITKLLRKNVEFKWSEACEKEFIEMKDLLISSQVLAFPDFENEFILTTDASLEALGAVLSQKQNGVERPIAFASRTLNSTEQRYSATERELLAIVWGIRNFKCYVYGRKFTVYTDHKPLTGEINLKETTSRIARFQDKLEEYMVTIKYKPGNKNKNADALSRIPECNAVTRQKTREIEQEQKEIEINGLDENLDKMELWNKTKNDSNIKMGNNTEDDKQTEIEDDDLQETAVTILTDRQDINTILKDYHDSPLGGHLGITKTFYRIRKFFKWKNMLGDIETYIKSCVKCQRNKASRAVKMPMVIPDVPDRPFEVTYMDVVGPLPASYNGNLYILTFQDSLTKFIDCHAMPNQEATTVARIFFDEIISRYGVPKILITDNGSNFTSDLFKRTCKFLKIKKLEITAYHPQSNGSLERCHRPLGDYLRNYVDTESNNWDVGLRQFTFIYNNSRQTSTKFTPHESLFGFTTELPNNLTKEPSPLYNNDDYALYLQHKLRTIHKLVKQNQIKSKEKSKLTYDKNINPKKFNVGTKVWVKNPRRKNKLEEMWTGPYEVIGIKEPVNTKIRMGRKEVLIHNNRLKEFFV